MYRTSTGRKTARAMLSAVVPSRRPNSSSSYAFRRLVGRVYQFQDAPGRLSSFLLIVRSGWGVGSLHT